MVNCTFNECFKNRANKSGKYQSLALFKLTGRKGEFYEKWKKEVLNIVTKYKHVDANFKKQIQSGNIYICEKHYKKEDVEITRKLPFVENFFHDVESRLIKSLGFFISKTLDHH